jgi:hypothetical protein
MATKAEIRQKTSSRKEAIITLCMDEPRNIEEMTQCIDMTRQSAVHFYVQDLIENGQLRTFGIKQNAKGFNCFSYLATASTYAAPVKIAEPVAIIPYVPEMVKPIEYKPVIIKINAHTRKVLLENNVHTTRTEPKSRDAWIGSTFSTMSF